MGMELQLRQSNFSTQDSQLRHDVTYETAKEMIGAYCVTRQENEKE